MADEEHFDLCVALQAIAGDSPEVIKKLEEDEQQVKDLRQNIITASRKNWILERQLQDLDEKIKLLIKHRITVQEIIAQSTGLQEEVKAELDKINNNPLEGKKLLYEDFFYLLQVKPSFFGTLARLCEAKEIPLFVQTVVFDMYGDQYDTREERLLLSLFKHALEEELSIAKDRGSLLRANTAVTQMLSAYARRGQGLSVLKGILEEPLRNITSRKDLNLEISPMKVYTQMIQDYETETGQQSTLPKTITDEQAAQNPDVIKIIESRVKELLEMCDYILQRIIAGVESIPYGMRWVCKQLGVLYKQKWPDADRYQIGSLMGGYIYLRFFNPVIVTPDAINFVNTKPSRVMRRNLILIAKVLQNLSNGLLFGEKEQYMTYANPFIQSRLDPLQDYFDKLVNVDDLDETLQVDKLLEHTGRMNVIQLSLNQILLFHSLCERHLNDLDPEELGTIVKKLGPAPPPVSKEDDRTIVLQLVDRRRRMSTSGPALEFLSGPRQAENPLYIQAKNLLLSLLRSLPIDPPPTDPNCPAKDKHLLAFLQEQRELAVKRGDKKSAESLTNVSAMLQALSGMKLLQPKQTPDETYDYFLWEFAKESRTRSLRAGRVSKRLEMIRTALASIDSHHDYLQSRLELYRIYLDNVRKGGVGASPNPGKEKKKKPTGPLPTVKIPLEKLETMGVITRIVSPIDPKIRKKIVFHFTMAAPGVFKVELALKNDAVIGVELKLPMQPVTLALEDLLKKQEEHQQHFEVEDVVLNVNLLVYLLNKEFIVPQNKK